MLSQLPVSTLSAGLSSWRIGGHRFDLEMDECFSIVDFGMDSRKVRAFCCLVLLDAGRSLRTTESKGKEPVEMTLDSSSLELIRRQTLEKAADELRRAANQLEDLSGVVRPALSRDVEDIRTSVALARGSLVVIDKVGLPGGD